MWVDTQSKQIVIAFRGTEQIKIKDILTDMNLAQMPYEAGGCEELKDALIHKGFLTAFKSVRSGLLQLLRAALVPRRAEGSTSSESTNEGKWEIYVTGHSLGGALATLFTFELSRLQYGYWSSPEAPALNPFKTVDKKKLFIPLSDDSLMNADWPSIIYRNDQDFLNALKRADIRMYR